MKNVFITAFATVALLATPVAVLADQYAIETQTAVSKTSARLLDALKIELIDAVEIQGRHFTIIEAPNEAYVEAFVLATHVSPVALYSLEADWKGAGLNSLPVEARAPFLLSSPCDYCSS